VMFSAAWVLLASAQNFNFDGMGGGNSPSCKSYSCSKGFVPVPKRPMKLSSPGCHGFGMSMFSAADKGKHDPLVGCCDLRHACYGICGSSKKRCEDDFKKCSDAACAAVVDAEEKKSCEQTSSIHAMSASFGGCKSFDDAQKSQCDCVAKDRAAKRRKQSLTDFYKKHNKDKLEDVEKLWQKHGKKDAWKFAKLLGKLVATYPKAVKSIKTKEQQMYDEILKGNYKNEGGGGDKKESSNSEGGAPKAEQKMDESYESATTDEDVEILDLDLEEDGHDEM